VGAALRAVLGLLLRQMAARRVVAGSIGAGGQCAAIARPE